MLSSLWKLPNMMNNLRQRCLDLADEMSEEINGNLCYVPDEDIENCLKDLTEDNIQEVASELANLAYWFN